MSTQQIDQPTESTARPAGGRGTSLVLLAGPLLVVASELVAPRWPDGLSAAQDAAFVTDHGDRLMWSWLVGLAAAGFLAAGFVLVATRLDARGRIAGRVAAVLGVTGATGLAAHMATELFMRDLVLADPAAASVLAGAEDGLALIVQILMLVFGTTLGLIALAVGVTRAGLVGRWVVPVAVLALVADFSPTGWSTTLFGLLMAVVMAGAARGLASRTRP